MSSATLVTFDELANRSRQKIDAALAAYADFPPGCPQKLGQAIRHSLLAPGKRLRPLLVLWAAEACGGSLEAALPAACAVEMVHAYSLIHDDLPAMDDDDLRRGRPTCHKVFGEALAILAGDALLALAFEVLSRYVEPAATAARCCAVLATAAGATELVGGQADDLAYEDAPDAGLDTLEAIHRRKTGAMFLASLELGGLIAGASPAQLAALRRYGQAIGLAFQITDDLLDVRGNTQEVGKRVGKDHARGKLTFPGLLGVDQSISRAEALVREACTVLTPLGAAAVNLEAIARSLLERTR